VIAIDTNIIIRLLTRDDETQYQHSYRLLAELQVYIPDSVILEVEWVLRFAYDFTSTEICQALRKILGLPNVHVTDIKRFAQVIAWHENGLDFADALHLTNSQHCAQLKTFDARFIKRSAKLSACVVQKA
jgi:predicted nucleic-acid-binding protein